VTRGFEPVPGIGGREHGRLAFFGACGTSLTAPDVGTRLLRLPTRMVVELLRRVPRTQGRAGAVGREPPQAVPDAPAGEPPDSALRAGVGERCALTDLHPLDESCHWFQKPCNGHGHAVFGGKGKGAGARVEQHAAAELTAGLGRQAPQAGVALVGTVAFF